MSRLGVCVLAALLAGKGWAQQQKEQPAGLVLTAPAGKVMRANTETAISIKAGEILFSGDTIRTEGAPATFLYCPGKTSQTLAPGGEVVLESKQLKIKTGKLVDQKSISACFLPQMVRLAAASQQHYGVSMTRSLGSPIAPVAPDKLAPEIVAELLPLDKTLAADPQDMSAVLGRAAIFEKHKLLANALAEYRKVGNYWKDAIWVKRQIFEMEEALTSAAAKAAAEQTSAGQAFALVVGISKYQKLPQDVWLQYADKDAEEFAKHVRSPRGGGLPAENVILLTNEQATNAAVRTAFQTFLKARAGKKDTVYMLMAAHGIVETAGSRGAYILAYDSDPQDLASTALPMAELQNLLQQQLSNVGRVIFYVDVCHAGAIGSIKSMAINGTVERLGEAEGEIFGFMASRPKELSYEGPQFGGGHGAFTYYLLKGFAGEADKNKDGVVNVNETIAYVRDNVAQGTSDKQHPRDFGTIDNASALADVKKPGIPVSRLPVLRNAAGDPILLASAAAPELSSEQHDTLKRFQAALNAGKILPVQTDSAFRILVEELKKLLPPGQYLQPQNQLRIALEDRSQQVLLRYLAGEQVAQTRDDFAAGALYVEAASLLTPESLYLRARNDFFHGRTLLFDKKYSEATDLLERSIEIDPTAAYAYNALGIAYLEQADFKRAAAAFRDAVRRAPYWAYPLHNLALTYVETGNNQLAIREYQNAIRLAPDASYLPYNLGLVYQRINRRKEAEAAYRKAIALAPQSGEPYNALGALKTTEGKRAEAEQLYRSALEKNEALLPARHNLALLLWNVTGRHPEAIDLWRANLKRVPEYLPSLLSLADALAEQGDINQAIQEYRIVLKLKPDYVAAYLALARLLQKAGEPAAALEQLREASKREPENPIVLEQIGDLNRAEGRATEAKEAYETALRQTADGTTRKRLRGKLRVK